MKKVISTLLVTVCLCLAIPAQAQLKFGVKGGLNVSKVSFDKDLYSSDNRTGFFIGPMAEFQIPIIGLGVDGALLYSQKDLKVESDDGSITGKSQGLDIPINLKYTIGLGDLVGVYVAAGPDFYFDFAKSKTYTDGEVDKKKTQVGFNVGAGVKLINHLQVGVNYNIPLGNSGDVSFKDATDKVFSSDYKTKTWQVSVAYIF